MRKLMVYLCVFTLLVPANILRAQEPATASKEIAVSKDSPATKLPVKRVVLYKNGVGYFEHLGRVRGAGDVTIDFTSAQLDDVLKSLTVLDLGGGRITGVGYNSDAPLARQLGAMRLPLGQETTVAQFLGALRGARLEVRSGTTAILGRLLSVERKMRANSGTTLEVDVISLVTDTGEVRSIELSPSVGVRVVDRELGKEVGRYLDLVGSTRAQDLRRMAISTAGSGERPLFVSYISEVPVWKTTYRIVLSSKSGAKPLLQGWAIVDNTVGEDWNNVELSLVAGAPQSFIQQISQPHYTRRPTVALSDAVQLTPQTHQATLFGANGQLSGVVTDVTGAVVPGTQVSVFDDRGNRVARVTSDASGQYYFSTLPSGNYRLEFEQQGFRKLLTNNLLLMPGISQQQDARLEVGQAVNTLTVEARNSVLGANSTANQHSAPNLGSGRSLGSNQQLSSSELFAPGGSGFGSGSGSGIAGGSFAGVGAARAGLEAAAQGRELGDLFEYKLKERVSIAKNQSAMVPIVHSPIEVERVSLWNQSGGSMRPVRALWVTNTSDLTLDAGSFSVLEDETFAGEGLMDSLKPGEKRLLSYALDLGVQVQARSENDRQAVTRVRVVKGVMVHHSEEHDRRTYTVRNEDTQPRIVIIEHPVRPNWKLAKDSAQPQETSAGFHRFRITVEPKKTATLAVTETRPLETRYEIGRVDSNQIELFLKQKSLNPAIEQALRKIVEQKGHVAGLAAQASGLEEQMKEIFDDQQRLRENIKALKGSSEEKELLIRYTRQLNEQETRLDTLKKEKAALEKKKQQAEADLNKMIQDLAFDVVL
ncbi:MAG: carboxypeptidase regulatory-like domain-containing protein [Acidobacteria bacterium]|nr:carboxypeptidase regulatory-like domain-containing protein [Acidobacteriota bacterium]